ncbi:MAG: glycosyl transferase [Cryobacterium sp.]|nr:glycosyl transferase [Cryobacterium sp.]
MTLTRATRSLPIQRVSGRRVRQRPSRIPSVTVIIPCFNYARFLRAAVSSALSQNGVSIDVVIVDDASTDDSAAVAEELVAADSRVRLLTNKHNLGAVGTFNAGLEDARGEYLIRLDADDMLTPGSAGRATALAEAFPGVGMVYGRPRHFSSATPPRHRDRATSWRVSSGADWLDLRCRLAVNCITSPEVVMRRSVVDRIGGQRRLGHTHDMEMWFRLAREADVGWICGSDQAWHREHPDSMSALGVDLMTDLRERAEAFEVLFTDGMGDPSGNAARLKIAHEALADESLSRASSAFVKGRGGTVETDGYIQFARSLGVDLAALPHAGIFARAERLGPRRAPLSPSLFGWAVLNRVSSEWGRFHWQKRGI